MRARLLNLWDFFRTGFWFIPTLLILGAILLAIFVPIVDYYANQENLVPDWLKTSADTYRSTLTALASGMLTVASVVFSVTVVTLSLTTSQFGPRLLRNLLEQNVTQATVGGCLASSVYCLMLLWRIDSLEKDGAPPHLSVFLATLMTVAAIAMAVFFIHRVARSVQSMNVVTDVSRDLDGAMQRLFPEKWESRPDREKQLDELRDRFENEEATSVAASKEGYLQAINVSYLDKLAEENGLVIQVLDKPGAFLIAGYEVARFLDGEPQGGEQEGDESIQERIAAAFIVGNQRTPRQDLECAVEELVEIAVRALSPGINDPFTAVASIDRLTATLCRLAERDLRSSLQTGDDTQRILFAPLAYSSVLEAAFNMIRQYGASSVSVSIRLLEGLEKIAGHTTDSSQREAVRRQAEMVLAECEKQDFTEGDMDDLRGRHERVLAAIESAGD